MAAIGAICLVGAFALASLLRPFATLAEVVGMIDAQVLQTLEQAERSAPVQFLWLHAALPVLMRPAWLMPTMAGLVCVGVAATLAFGERR